jgi:hypothetical protein
LDLSHFAVVGWSLVFRPPGSDRLWRISALTEARGTRSGGQRLGEGDRWEQSMIEVRQVVADGVDEAWERVIGEPDVRGVEAGRIDFAGGWNVTVAVMEFVREDPLESELRRRIAALRSVRGVQTADEMDREVWFVTGTPSGDTLVRAAAEVVDDLAGQTRAYAGG